MSESKREAGSALPMASVVDRETGLVSRGVVLPPLSPADRGSRLAEVGLMSVGIAHDLRNLMQIIEAGLRGMERRFDVSTAAELRVLHGQVGGAAQRASRLAGRIVDHVRGAASDVDLVDVGAAVLQMRTLIGWAAGPHVRVAVEVEAGLPPAPCALAELETAVINLVVNARQAMPEGGAIALSVAGAAGDVVLRVADTGCGMSEAAARRACEPFYSTKAASGGSGLGLAVVAAFVSAQGGSLALHSQPGCGTAVVMTLRGARGQERGSAGDLVEPPDPVDRE